MTSVLTSKFEFRVAQKGYSPLPPPVQAEYMLQEVQYKGYKMEQDVEVALDIQRECSRCKS